MNCIARTMISVAALFLAVGSGHADVPTPNTSKGDTDTATTSTSEAGPALDEIVVTALKRRESLQHTPAAVTALGADDLTVRGVTDLRALEAVIPSARFLQEGYSTDPFIRGVGQSQGWASFDPAVATNFNGIYVPRDATDVPVFDAERIEVLPGPQGTLYGRSAAGGAVNIIAKRPSMDYEGELLVESGNYDLAHATAIGNVPVTSELAVRAAVDFDSRDGYESNGAYAHQGTSTRLGVLWTPSSNFTAYLWGEHYRDSGTPSNLITIPFLNPSNPWYIYPAGQPVPGHPGLVGPDDTNRASVVHDFFGGQIDWHISRAITLSYIPGYTYANNNRFFTLGSVTASGYDLAFNVRHGIRQLTNELKTTGDAGPWSWVAGIYQYRSQEDIAFLFPTLPTSYAPFQYMPYYLAEGYAAYGNATVSATDGLRFSVGARYSSDAKHGIGATNFNAPSVAAFNAGTPGTGFDFANRWTHADWRVGIEYDLAPSVLLYGNVQTGYLPGAFNNDLPAGSARAQLNVLPVTLLAYTAGVKSSFLGDSLRINDEAYKYDYKNFQAGVYDGSDSSTTVFNAKRTNIYGDELTIRYLLTAADQFSFNVGYLHAQYTDFIVNTFIHGGPLSLNLNGYQAYMSPGWTAGLGYGHTFVLPSGAEIVGQVDSFLSTSYWSLFDHNPGSQQGSYTKTDVSLTYYAPGKRWSVAVWGKNLENAATISNTGDGGAAGSNVGYVDAPRTYGARITYRFQP